MARDTPAKPLSRDLVRGSWKCSWVTRDVATGERHDALGQNPRGMVMYTPSRVVFLITKNDRRRPENLPLSNIEKVELLIDVRIFRRITVKSDRIIHHVDLSWNEAWCGTDQVRFCVVDGDTLTYT